MDKQLKLGDTTDSGYTLTREIKSLDEFWKIINSEKSIYARHRMYPTAFFHSWNIRLIKSWMDRSWFFQTEKKLIDISRSASHSGKGTFTPLNLLISKAIEQSKDMIWYKCATCGNKCLQEIRPTSCGGCTKPNWKIMINQTAYKVNGKDYIHPYGEI